MTASLHSIFPLKLKNLTIHRKGKKLLGPLDLTIGNEENSSFVMVIGPNGSGKTTFLKSLQGLERADTGAISWNVSPHQAHQSMSLVFQTPIVLRRNVLQNVCYPLTIKGASTSKAKQQAMEWLDKVGLSDFAERPAGVLSGGEKQKLAFARAMVSDPQLLLLDEPTANLDNAAKLELESLLQTVMENGTRIIMASHDMGQVKRLATSVLFLNHGLMEEFSDAETFPATENGARFLNGEIIL